MNKKIYILLITIITIIILFLIGWLFWHNTNTGAIQINTSRDDILYIFEDKEYYSTKTFKNIRAGSYKIYSFGKNEKYYFPEEYIIKANRNETTILDIELELTTSNPDKSGEEYGY